MNVIYTSGNHADIAHVYEVLQANRIVCSLRNWYLVGSAATCR